MSELYRIKIVSVQERQVRALVTIVHPDAGNRFAYRDFALQILLETADKNMYWTHLPLPEADWLASLQNHPLKAEFDTLLGYLHGEKIPITEEEYNLLRTNKAFYEAKNTELTQQYGRGIIMYGHSKETSWYIGLETNDKALVGAAYQIIPEKPARPAVKDSAGNIVNRKFYLDFGVIDAQYLAHLVVNMEYETAAYVLE